MECMATTRRGPGFFKDRPGLGNPLVGCGVVLNYAILRLETGKVKPLKIAALTLGGFVAVGALGTATFDLGRHGHFADAVAQLEGTWTQDLSNGVPASSIDPLRAELTKLEPTAPSWTPAWMTFNGDSVV